MRIFGLNITRSERQSTSVAAPTYALNPLRNIFRFKLGQRFSSEEFESAVNEVLTANMVADKTRQPVITQESSLALTAVWACVRILSETVGTLPIHLYRRTSSGRERTSGHPASRILQTPNSFSNRFDLMHFLMVSCTLWGNGYVRIFRDRQYRPQSLKYLHPARITPVLSDKDELFYRLDTGEMLQAEDIIHLRGLSTDGIKGKSPIILSLLTTGKQAIYLNQYPQR
jgi:phage portal protein BeeE